MLEIENIGCGKEIAGWPERTIDGLFEALERWPLDPRLDFSRVFEMNHDPRRAPFRGRAWAGVKEVRDPKAGTVRLVATRPIYPDSPDAVSYLGNFFNVSWLFSLSTDDAELIARLDAAIAKNMQLPGYVEAESKIAQATRRACARRYPRPS